MPSDEQLAAMQAEYQRRRLSGEPLPLAPIYVLQLYGLWPEQADQRDRRADVTDDQVSALL
jgi:hypothetical protein